MCEMLPNIRALEHHEGDRVLWVEIYTKNFVVGFLLKRCQFNRAVSASKIRKSFRFCMMTKAMKDVALIINIQVLSNKQICSVQTFSIRISHKLLFIPRVRTNHMLNSL
jgi:hypothetical protein